MKPVTPVLKRYPGALATEFARTQPQYKTLPALVSFETERRVTTRWELTWRERWRIFISGNLWLQMLTFDEPLQPVKILTEEPTIEECK